MFLLRKFRLKTLGVIVVVLIAVAMVTIKLVASNHGNATRRTEEQLKPTVNVTAAGAVPKHLSDITDSQTLSERLKVINSSAVMRNQLQRQRHLAAACRRLGLSHDAPDFKTSDMYINDTLRYIYCVVNKVACTSWKRVLLMASGQMTVNKPEQLTMTFVHDWRKTDHYFPRIRTLSFEEIQERLKTHFKFVFVRHPLQRLVSTYRDKFTKPAVYYPRRFGTLIIRTVRGANASEKSLRRGHDVTFPEMIRYLLNVNITRKKDQLLSDNHWLQQHLLCHPCYMNYDFIGHYETLYEDARAVLQVLGVADRVRFPDTDPNNKWRQKTADVSAKILAEIGAEELRKVNELYAYDFELFGYDPNVL